MAELKPGDVTTLGALRPGDVGEWCGFGKGAPKLSMEPPVGVEWE